MVRIQPGSFQMGSDKGDWDETPVHSVTISRPFYVSTTEVTNAQYEEFDPSHRRLRGRHGLSLEDDEAVVFVSWDEAVRFTEWLTEREGKPYRLPTEAEWEYAARAGTRSAYVTGETLPATHHRQQSKTLKDHWGAEPVSLRVGTTPASPWGLFDMHGNVEEWCLDGYGPYPAGPQTDPAGRINSVIKVTRGGSHSTLLPYLRSANRSGSVPQDKSWLIGFRVVQADPPSTPPLAPPPPPAWAREVQQETRSWQVRNRPFFETPIPYVRIEEDANGPLFFHHNHCPAVAWCDNGDLLAAWFSTNSESGREMTIAAGRLKAGADRWTVSEEFFNAPDRNMTGTALLNDGRGTLYYLQGLGASQGWQINLALALRTSSDHGATWSHPRLVNPMRGDPERINQPIASLFQLRNGTLVLPSDAPRRLVEHPAGAGTALWMSPDKGATWTISEGTIAGIHAGVVELENGDLLALGRSKQLTDPGDRLPVSLSKDGGHTWAYSFSEFPAIGGAQRLVLRRLREGPLLLVSFTDVNPKPEVPLTGMRFKGPGGGFRGYGMFAALSYDEGKSWPVRKLLTTGGPTREYYGWGWTHEFSMDQTHAEPKGYLTGTQTPDGVIHLLSSGLHYRFNLAWLEQ